jgi:NodT family efflux transporter outer membrane factor (OMF) lipoprotein
LKRGPIPVLCLLLGGSLLGTVTGCAVGPDYKRPVLAVPDQFRGASPVPDPSSLADLKWESIFHDDALTQLIQTALADNFDLGIASERVLQARAQFRITRGNEFPLLNAQAGFTALRSSSIGSSGQLVPASTNLSSSYTQVGASLSWEIDLWGKLRRLTESAKAQYLATEETKRGVIVSLIADVMDNYFVLCERDLELAIAQQTRDVAGSSLKLVQLRHDRGAATGLDVYQAEQLLYTATAQIASSERDIEQGEDALRLMLGQVPGAIVRGKPFEGDLLPESVPSGLPAALLEHRPDVREAEQMLISANAQIGAARALYFPQITLTGLLGAQSRELAQIFTGPGRFDSIAPGALLPIFNAGQTRAQVHLSEAVEREMLVTYRKTLYTALREVSDALIGYERTRDQKAQEQLLVHALSESTRLSRMRYAGGLDNYLQVLDSERSLFQGQVTLAQLRLQERLGIVQIYRSLGGGWQ